MSQRDSGYQRKERDNYETPEWVTEALLPHLPDRSISVWEPACGSGKMVAVLKKYFVNVSGTDIANDEFYDFLMCSGTAADAIITNPPYALATLFVNHAINLMRERRGMVAMLLRTDFDHASGRKKLFSDSPCFAKKVVLTKRIRWFENSKGSPSFNHAWFIWSWIHSGPPTLAYGP
jgi:hypothetical protein